MSSRRAPDQPLWACPRCTGYPTDRRWHISTETKRTIYTRSRSAGLLRHESGQRRRLPDRRWANIVSLRCSPVGWPRISGFLFDHPIAFACLKAMRTPVMLTSLLPGLMRRPSQS